MMKFAITVGQIGKKIVVLKEPSDNPEDHFAFIRALTTDGGKLKGDKKAVSVAQAVVLHSTKGVLRKRKF